MVLNVQSDELYLLEYQAYSQDGGNLFLGSQNFDPNDSNGAILTVSKIIKNVMASASKNDYAALFINARKAIVLQTTFFLTSATSHTHEILQFNL